MNNKKNALKIVLLVVLVTLVTVLHYSAGQGHLGLHMLHRELYFIPILLASFWFGLKFGLAAAVVISLIYAPHVFFYDDPHGTFLTVASQILVFNLVAIVLGWLVDRQRRQQHEMLEAENLAVLGRAAVAVGHEMKDMLGALRRLAHHAEALQCTELESDFQQEMTRLEGMVETLSSYVPPEQVRMISKDINDIINEHVEKLQETARKSEIQLQVELDDLRCPTRIDVEKVGWALDNLIKNALEVSSPGQTITVSSHRGSGHCRLEVKDQGPGIRPEHLPRIFMPFFTTKEKGTGLGLAACKKFMRDLGGDISVSSRLGEGATFTLTIPRENP